MNILGIALLTLLLIFFFAVVIYEALCAYRRFLAERERGRIIDNHIEADRKYDEDMWQEYRNKVALLQQEFQCGIFGDPQSVEAHQQLSVFRQMVRYETMYNLHRRKAIWRFPPRLIV